MKYLLGFIFRFRIWVHVYASLVVLGRSALSVCDRSIIRLESEQHR